MAKVLAQPQYLNAPEVVIDQVITGRYADGLGNIKTADDRVDYQPFPHYSAAVWLMTQLRRWNIVKDDIDYKALAQQVMLATDAAKIMKEMGVQPPPRLRQGDHPRSRASIRETAGNTGDSPAKDVSDGRSRGLTNTDRGD